MIDRLWLAYRHRPYAPVGATGYAPEVFQVRLNFNRQLACFNGSTLALVAAVALAALRRPYAAAASFVGSLLLRLSFTIPNREFMGEERMQPWVVGGVTLWIPLVNMEIIWTGRRGPIGVTRSTAWGTGVHQV